jgi:hypothetical protein
MAERWIVRFLDWLLLNLEHYLVKVTCEDSIVYRENTVLVSILNSSNWSKD